MKIRSGFVSNSSSSSFCLLGVYIAGEDKEAQKLFHERIGETELELEYACNEWDDSITVGLPPYKMQEDETLRQFKERVVTELKKIDADDWVKEISWHTDGGYNG